PRQREVANPGQPLRHRNAHVRFPRLGTCKFLWHARGAARIKPNSTPGRSNMISLTWLSANDDICQSALKLEIQKFSCAAQGQYTQAPGQAAQDRPAVAWLPCQARVRVGNGPA